MKCFKTPTDTLNPAVLSWAPPVLGTLVVIIGCVFCVYMGQYGPDTSVESVDTMECMETPSPHNTAIDGWGHSHHGHHYPPAHKKPGLFCVS